MESKSFKYMKDGQSMTRSHFVTEVFVDEDLTALEYEEEVYVYPNMDSTKVSADQVRVLRISPVYGLGYILVLLTFLSLCNAIYRFLQDTEGGQSEESIHRISPRNSPVTPTRTPSSLRVIRQTTPKRITPAISRFPPGRTYLSNTTVPHLRRRSPESIETFEPRESYRFYHPDIPNELLRSGRSNIPSTCTPESDIPRTFISESDYFRRSSSQSHYLRRSTSESNYLSISIPESDYLRRSTPELDYLRISIPESDILPLHERTIHPSSPSDYFRRFSPQSDYLGRSTPESDILPLHERTIQPPSPFTTDGIKRRKLSFTVASEWSSSDPDGVNLRPHSTPKDS